MGNFFYNKEIILLKETGGGMYHGVMQKGVLSPYKTISCDVQPANRDLIFKEYGYYIDCTKRVFCDVDLEITDGSMIEFRGKQFKINKMVEWDDYLDIFMKEV
jgi:hypothetical protein